jgi:hypothetical protein
MPLVYSFCHIARLVSQLQTTFVSGKVQAHKVGLLERIQVPTGHQMHAQCFEPLKKPWVR